MIETTVLAHYGSAISVTLVPLPVTLKTFAPFPSPHRDTQPFENTHLSLLLLLLPSLSLGVCVCVSVCVCRTLPDQPLRRLTLPIRSFGTRLESRSEGPIPAQPSHAIGGDQSRHILCAGAICQLRTGKVCLVHLRLLTCMSATRFTRAARPLSRSLAPFNAPRAAARQRFTTTSTRRAAPGNGEGPRTASTWPFPVVFAATAAAGLLGWGASEIRHQGFPGAVLLDGTFAAPAYASVRGMEQVYIHSGIHRACQCQTPSY